jgi:serine/threonine-protein kinase
VHTRLERHVAIKVLRSEHANKTNLVRRFFQEARAANQIAHENIVEITDLVTDEDGRCYIIMELLSGESLEAVQDRDGILPLGRSLSIARQVCSALAAAHAAGIVHRDLKPGNVFLTRRPDGGGDFVKLLDFGVAKLSAAPEPPPELSDEADAPVWRTRTQQGSLLGTPDYMSPEQASGRPVDHRADIYSLGVVLYEMMTGVRPLSGDTLQDTLLNHINISPAAPSTISDLPHVIPSSLERVIIRMLSKDPEARPSSVTEVQTVIEHLLQERADARAPTVRPGRARWPLVAAVVLALGILAAVGQAVRSAFTDPPAGTLAGVPAKTRPPDAQQTVRPPPEAPPKRTLQRARRAPPPKRVVKKPLRPKSTDRNAVIDPF